MKKLITFIVTLSAAVIPQSLDSIPFEYWKVSDFGMAFEVEAKDKFNSQGSISQDWMPLALGNKWQYIKTTAEYPFNNPTNNISTDSVNEK
ncbi:MAG: hypothetical protein Q8Q47_00970, partial [Ignavibacteriaceae bacterium]|nr:hypothetical protein [Ignavibacteriaceae bacterium]